MTNDDKRIDVRWLDERALHAAALGNDPEAFAELMRRYDPVVRYHVWRVLGGRLLTTEALDEHIADFWCAMVEDDLASLRAWDPERALLANWLGTLASRRSGEALRRLMSSAA
jgi:hypothetical protein